MNGTTSSTMTTKARDGKPLVGVTMGDPCGIGAEVIVKALNDPDIRAMGRFVIFGMHEILTAAAEEAGIRPFWFCAPTGADRRIDSGVIVVDHAEYPSALAMHARPSAEGGRASLGFFDEAIQGVKSGEIDAIVTGPIHKTSWKKAGCRFPGHTEKLADALGVRRYTMSFVGGGMRIALASAHVGLFELRNHFTLGSVFQPIDLLNDALRQWFGIERPRIAVAGLNPHAGENGQFGDEERRVIEPAIQMARNVGIEVQGPFSPDTLFLPKHRTRFDGIVAMYHDQALIPLKMLAFDTAVNLTLGLPIIRTSPDHGTAFDIVGTDQANEGSMKEALGLACQLVGRNQVSMGQPAASSKAPPTVTSADVSDAKATTETTTNPVDLASQHGKD